MGCADSGAGCKGTKKGIRGSKLGINLSSITSVLSILAAAFKIQSLPVTPLPPPLLMIGAKLRPGLSPRTVASRILARQSEAGAPQGDIFSEDSNISEAMETIRVQEIIFAIQNDAKVEITIPPGVPVNTVGVGNLGAPVLSQGATVGIASGDGIVR